MSVIKLSSMLSLKESVLTFFLFDAPNSLKIFQIDLGSSLPALLSLICMMPVLNFEFE